MFPDNELSNPAQLAGFYAPMKTLALADRFKDWEWGGIALSDPAAGLMYQLWEFSLVVDAATGDSDVFAEAPNTPPTLLFSGSFITEIAGCFDQNMKPMVAYTEGGDARFWWWDSTVAAMVHTTLPAGCADLRCALDEKRRFNVAESDVILSYIRGGALYFRLQRERYAVENLLFNAGAIERLVCAGMNVGSRFQWRLLGQADDTRAISVAEPWLGDIVYELCRSSGLLPEQIDVADLYRPDDLVPGLKVAVDEGVDEPLEWLRPLYQFDKSQHNKKLVFEHKGKPVSFRIPYEQLVTNGTDQPLKQERVDEKKLPRKVNVSHIDSEGGFARNKQTATRRSNLLTTEGERSIESKVVLTPDKAATAALTIIKAAWGEQYEYKFTTTIWWSMLTPGDVGEVEDKDGTWHHIRIEEKNEDSGLISWEAMQDAGELTYGNSANTGNPLDPPVSTTPGLVGDTVLEILNLPVQRDQDDELGLYIAARGASSGWSGYALSYSVDGGTTYVDAYTSSAPCNIGETSTSMTDSATTVEVLVPLPLASVTAGQLAAGYNRAVIGDEEVQYQTATLLGMVGALYHYNLTGMVRGVLRTLYEAWPAGARFVAIDESVVFAQVQRQFYGEDILYKAVSLGQPADEVTAVAYLFDFAFSQTEWAVSNVVVVNNPDGAGVVTTWTPAPRLGTFGAAPYESKYFRGYRLKYSDGLIVDVAPGTYSHTHLTAAGGVTVRIFSLNDTTGENAWGEGSGGTGGTGGGTGGSPGGNIGDPDELFGYGGTLSGGYAGVPYPHTPGDSFYVSGGYWDAQCFGELVPGVCTWASGPPLSAGFQCSGWPLAAGSYTTNIYPQASSPTPGGSGGALLNEPITIYAYPTYSLIDLQWTTGYTRNVVNTTPPLTTFDYITAGSDWSMPYTTGKRWGEITLGAATYKSWIGISNAKGVLTVADYTIGIGYGSPCSYWADPGHVYRIEHDADTGDWEIFKDGVSVLTGNLPLPAGKLYRMVWSGDYVQAIRVKFNFGGETPVGTPTAGFTGIPMPAVKRPVVWRAYTPLTTMQFTGSLIDGPIYSFTVPGGGGSGGGMSIGHIGKSAGKWKVKITGGSRRGFCVAAYDYTVGPPGDAGTADSIGYRDKISNLDPAKVYTCFGGVTNVVDVDWQPTWDLSPVWLCDFTAGTVKLCAVDRRYPDTVIIVHTITSVPTGPWFPMQYGGGNGVSVQTVGVPESGGYDEWTVSYP